MFVRTTRIKRGTKVYEYPQLVESYRQENGTPTHRVIASLKDWSPQAIENLRLTLATSRESKPLVPESAKPAPTHPHQVLQNLDYLSLAVLDDCWTEQGVGDILDDILPSTSICSHGNVLRTLVLHRCVAPGSKSSACQWYPTTALPEMLGVKARYFNNSRVHRALDALAHAEDQIQARVSERVLSAGEGVVATYLDLTDTWFVGRGPPMASRGRTKEGLVRRKIGIALLCDQRGLPLRWETVDPGLAESRVMLDLLRRTVDDGVFAGQPVVMDRAMGRGAHMAALADMGVSFVTAIVRNEFTSFVEEGPWMAFDDVEVSGSPRTVQRDLEALAEQATKAGMTGVDGESRFVLDLGVGLCVREEERSHEVGQAFFADLLAEADFMTEMLASGRAASKMELASWYGVSSRTIWRYLSLVQLDDSVQERISSGHAEDLRLEELQRLALLPASIQLAVFTQLLAHVASIQRDRARPPKILDVRRKSLLLRRVVWFSPDNFMRRRATAHKQLKILQDGIESLNTKQQTAVRPRTELIMRTHAREQLKRLSWLKVFAVSTRVRRMNGRDHHELVLTRDEVEWARRRRLDGFGVVAASPSVYRNAEDLVRLYFSKDMVEKDFQTIKSELDMRPVHHRTDLKVHAHVSVCMLALFLRRVLEERLRAAGLPMTAGAVHNALATCHLNRLAAVGSDPYYAVTRPTPDQQDILTALELRRLVDTEHVAGKLRPR